jgi:hypothetical protein
MIKKHSFHIPVMGLAFTIDTPLKVAPFGMDSVISIGDDILLEKLRKMYCRKYQMPYSEITDKAEDFRAKRITSYLNMIKGLAEQKFEEFKSATLEKGEELKKYIQMLPDGITLKEEFKNFTDNHFDFKKASAWIKRNLSMGSIDVNIMTKLDKENYLNKEKLPVEFNDAHAALRGFAQSDLSSSMIFSAGMNPRLFSYIEQFEDFYSHDNTPPKKKIVLKVSDYRSALIQGKFFAKKGLWVSEYRIESGLNCGGHAFASEGFLMGPILNEFKEKRSELIKTIHELMVDALTSKNLPSPKQPFPIKITAQGGVGTSEEHEFLLNEYQLASIGWGSPFLLVPEATTVDDATLAKLMKATEKDLYLSNISPLGVPINNLRGNTKDDEKSDFIRKGRPGSACPKKFLSLNKEFTEQAICTASRQYQHLKLKELAKENLSKKDYQRKETRIQEKSCICVGLGTSALLAHNLDTKTEGDGVSICPGPNLAYFSQLKSLQQMTDHIYGRSNKDEMVRKDRPHMFIKELDLYLDYLENLICEDKKPLNDKAVKKLSAFAKNLSNGIDYYIGLFRTSTLSSSGLKSHVITELFKRCGRLERIELTITKAS